MHSKHLFFRWASRHKAAIAMGITVSMVYGMHHVALWRAAREQGLRYHPLIVNEDEALFTGPKAHAAEMGEVIVGDFNVAEYKDTRIYVLPFLSPLIMGNIARAAGSIERAFIVSDFLFPPIIFLLFYALLLLLSERRMLSLFGAALFIFIPQFLLAVPPITPYLQATLLTLAAKGSSLYFSRVEDPQITIHLYLAAFIFFLLIFKGRKENWIAAVAGICYGLLFYSYFYYWMYVSIALAVGIIFLWHRMLAVRKRLIAATALGLLISIPHWINASLIAALPQYPDLFDRLGPEIGRVPNLEALPVFAYFLHGLLIGASWFFFRAADKGKALFLVSFLAPVYAAYNIQLVTGFNVHPDHWYKPALPIVNATALLAAYHAIKAYGRYLTIRTLVIPWAILALFLFFKTVDTEVALVRHASLVLLIASSIGLLWAVAAERYGWLRSRSAFACIAAYAIVLLLAKGISLQRIFIAKNAPKTIPAEEFASYQWLTVHTAAYSVVATPSFTTNARLQLYTRNRLLLPNGYNTIAGDDELWRRLRLTNALFGTGTSTYRSYLEGVSDLGGGGADDSPTDDLSFAFEPTLDRLAVYYLFHMKYLDASPGSSFKGDIPLSFPPSVIEREMSRYENLNFNSASPLPYRLDYIYYGPRERLLAPDASPLSTHEKIYDSGGIAIYRYIHE